MGSTKSKLSPELEKRVKSIFEKIDTDHSGTIDKEETLKYWKSNFAKLNTNELFNAVDADGNNKIELKEWMAFWESVKGAGHKEDEIMEEIEELENGKSWCKFSDVGPMGGKQNKKKNID